MDFFTAFDKKLIVFVQYFFITMQILPISGFIVVISLCFDKTVMFLTKNTQQLANCHFVSFHDINRYRKLGFHKILTFPNQVFESRNCHETINNLSQIMPYYCSVAGLLFYLT